MLRPCERKGKDLERSGPPKRTRAFGQGGAGCGDVIEEDGPPRCVGGDSNVVPGCEALGPGLADLPWGVAAGQALSEGQVDTPCEGFGDRCRRVEAAKTQAPGVGWDRNDGAGEGSCLGRDRSRGDVRQGEAVAELQGADELAGRAVVWGSGQGFCCPGDCEALGRGSGDGGRADVADRLVGCAALSADGAEGWGNEGEEAGKHARTVAISA
jgi:hypothetical protein